MSAQEMIRQELRAPWRTKKEIEQLSQELYEAVAHELAEQIRNSPELHSLTDGHMTDCNAAAYLIDPEVN